MITKIVKRDGRSVDFNLEKFTDAIFKAAQAIGGTDYEAAKELANKVCAYLEEELGETAPTVEHVQDTVERVLIDSGHARTAKEFIL